MAASSTSAKALRHSPPKSLQPGFHVHTLLLGLPREYTETLVADARRVEVKKGKILFARGDPGDGCYWLEQGTVKVTIASPDGEQRILAVLGPGAIVGELAMIDGLPRSATVEAVEDCRLLFVSRAAFQRWVADSPDLDKYLVKTLVARLRQADEEAAASSFLSGRARVARALLHLASHLAVRPADDDELVVPKLRQSDVAAMAGVTRESVSRILAEWRRLKVIDHPMASTYVIKVKELEGEAQIPK